MPVERGRKRRSLGIGGIWWACNLVLGMAIPAATRRVFRATDPALVRAHVDERTDRSAELHDGDVWYVPTMKGTAASVWASLSGSPRKFDEGVRVTVVGVRLPDGGPEDGSV